MKKRPLGRTGLQVSEIGFGAWGLGGAQWIGATEDESLRALHQAVDLGLNLVDTALAYGEGRSERVIGRLLKDRRGSEILVATKVPPKNLVWPASPRTPVSAVFPAEHIVRACEESLRNLDVERIDLLQLHVWQDAFLDQDGWKDAFFGLQKAGKVRFLGISVGEHDADSALRAASSASSTPCRSFRTCSTSARGTACCPSAARTAWACSRAFPSTRAGSRARSRPRPPSPRATSGPGTSRAIAAARCGGVPRR